MRNSTDPHESFLKTYMIQGKETGSEEYDHLFTDLAEFVKKGVPADYSPRPKPSIAFISRGR